MASSVSSKDGDEFALIQFVGETEYYIYNSSKLNYKKNGLCTARWTNKQFYEAKVFYKGNMQNCIDYKHSLTHESIVLIPRIVDQNSTSGAEKYLNKSNCNENSESCNRTINENQQSENFADIENHVCNVEAEQSEVSIHQTALSNIENQEYFSNKNSQIEMSFSCGSDLRKFSDDKENIAKKDQTCSKANNIIPEYENSSLNNISINYNSSSSSESDAALLVTKDSIKSNFLKPVTRNWDEVINTFSLHEISSNASGIEESSQELVNTNFNENDSEESGRVYIDASYSDDTDDCENDGDVVVVVRDHDRGDSASDIRNEEESPEIDVVVVRDDDGPIDDVQYDPSFEPEEENEDSASDIQNEEESPEIDVVVRDDDDPIDDEQYDPSFEPEEENEDSASDFQNEEEPYEIANNSEDEEPVPDFNHIETAPTSVESAQLDNHLIQSEDDKEVDVLSFANMNINPAAENKWTNNYHFCPFCKSRVTRFARHVLNTHRQEPDVIEINILPTNCVERKLKIAALRKKGMFEYNTDDKYNKGDLIVNRRPCKVTVKPKVGVNSTYIPCKNCKGFYQIANLAKHFKSCSGKRSAKGVVHVGRLLAKKLLPVYFENIENILLKGRNDMLTQIILNDESILYYGAKLATKYMHVRHMDNHIRSNMRQLARLYIVLRQLDPTSKCLLDCLHPLKFNNVIVATYQICGYDKDDRTFKNPSAALHIGGILAKCCDALLVQFIQMNDQVKLKQIEDFSKLIKSEFPVMASVANANLIQKKITKAKCLPIAADICKLNDYLRAGASQAYDNLLNTYSFSDWHKLASFTLVLILIFNRKRTGETQRLTIDNYNSKSTIEKGSDVYDALSEHEKILCGNFHRIEIRGKWGRTVPLLLTKDQISYIDIILRYREEAGVSIDNPYVFGIAERSYLFAGKILRNVAKECGAKNPATLRGTHLRKQIATVTQLIDMSDNDIKLLSQFMGHSQLIHEQVYRKTDSTLQIARLSKLLIAFNDGNMERYKGCTLKQLDAELDEDTSPNEATSSRDLVVENDNKNDGNETSSSSSVPSLSPKRKQPAAISKLRSSSALTEGTSSCETQVRKRTYCKKLPWSNSEKSAINRLFKQDLQKCKLPPFEKCKIACESEPALSRRTAKMIYAYINNLNKKQAT